MSRRSVRVTTTRSPATTGSSIRTTSAAASATSSVAVAERPAVSINEVFPTPSRDPLAGIVRAVPGGVVVAVHVQPRAGSTRLAGRHGDALKIRVSAPPVDGRATEAARVALADAVDVPPGAVRLIEGERSRLKRFRVDCDDPDAMLARIARLVSPADGA